MTNPEQWRPSIEEQIEAKFGKEMLESAAGITQGIFHSMKGELAYIGMQEGTSEQQRQAAKAYLEMLREFSNNLFSRTESQNARSPEVVRTAIEGANALMSVEPSNDRAAHDMAEQLEKRYGKRT